MNYQMFVGIDIAAKSAMVAWTAPDGKVSASQLITQTQAGFERLIEQLKRFGCAPEQVLVVMEATSTYWMHLALALYQAHVTVSVINPSQAHFFAKTQLQRTKTDAIDAQLLAQLALKLQPEPWVPPPAIYEELEQRLSQRDSLLGMRTQLRNRLHAFRQQPTQIPTVLAQLEAHLDFLQQQIIVLDKDIEALFSVEHEWGQSAQLLRSIPGLGTITAAWLLTATLNFTLCTSPEQAASYAGLAPHAHESGTSIRGRRVVGHAGHARLRQALYMAAISAVRCNPSLSVFYRHLRARGKPAKVALCAVARKLLHLAWAVVKHHRPFDPQYRQNSNFARASA